MSRYVAKHVKKAKGRYMKFIVAFIVLQVIAYTWLHMYLSYKVGMEIAPTTSVGFYTFCGCEAGICGWIKNRKGNGDE